MDFIAIYYHQSEIIIGGNMFNKALKALMAEYKRHQPQKGDSWRTRSIEYLVNLHRETYFKEVEDLEDNINRLIDHTLVGLMLLERELEV